MVSLSVCPSVYLHLYIAANQFISTTFTLLRITVSIYHNCRLHQPCHPVIVQSSTIDTVISFLQSYNHAIILSTMTFPECISFLQSYNHAVILSTMTFPECSFSVTESCHLIITSLCNHDIQSCKRTYCCNSMLTLWASCALQDL